MADNNFSKGVGVVPDFFHDILAYIIPGYTVLILTAVNLHFILGFEFNVLLSIDFGTISLLFIIAYVIGRIFEEVGRFIHHRRPLFLSGKNGPYPKWELLFGTNDHYTEEFQENLKRKIIKTFKKQNMESILKACEDDIGHKKDDYFNLIQFYLRERFPGVALYEKKQNATIILTRSLAMIFMLNVLSYIFLLLVFEKFDALEFDSVICAWMVFCILSSIAMYKRFRLDQRYHAMYIFESFIAVRPLLKKRKKDTDNCKAEPDKKEEG
jgi:hypothetical protein